MTIIRHGGDADMRCDRIGCLVTRPASQIGLPANVRGAAFRAAIAREGWVSRRATLPPGEDSRVATRMEDYCPAHAADVGGTTDEDWGLQDVSGGAEAEGAAREFRRGGGAMPPIPGDPPD